MSSNMRRSIVLSIMIVALVPLLLFNNCADSKVQFQSESSNDVIGTGFPVDPGPSPTPEPTSTPVPTPTPVGPTPSPTPTPDVVASCKNSIIYTQDYNVVIPNPNVTCPFGQGDNLIKRNQYLQARIEQSYVLSLPPTSKICDLAFSFPQQSFLYDDHFLFTLNEQVLASSYNFDGILVKQGDLSTYDWKKIGGIFWDTAQEGVFCPAKNANVANPAATVYSECSWPVTDTPGQIQLKYSPALIQNIMNLTPNVASHSFKFTTIGDDDELDCEHSNITFKVTVKYYKDN